MLGPLTDAMRIRDKLENYETVDEVLARPRRVDSRRPKPSGRPTPRRSSSDLKEKVLRDEVLTHGVRLDGRKFDEVRPIWIETGVLPRTHGSAVFTRGETQALVTCTLGTADDAQKIETLRGRDVEELHAPLQLPALLGRRNGPHDGPGPPRNRPRRARGARADADAADAKSSSPTPSAIVSDILESNGSSSMASVCGGSLAMMDAGVPLKAPVAGIAMGLVMDEKTGKYAVLTDIAGAEDHYGDMDFKVAGTADGITALQMDIKVSGITDRGDDARRSIRRAAAACTSSARCRKRSRRRAQNISTFAPRIVTIRIPVDKIRDVIGPGGKMIRSIIERTGVKIDVEDDGRVNVASADGESAPKAISIIQELTATPELNKTYLGKVQRITDFGAFVEIMPGTDGLLHVSEIANHRVKDVRDELKEGEQILVKVINIDPTGKIRLSRKALLTEEGGARERRRSPRSAASPGFESCRRGLERAARRRDSFANRRMAVEQPLHEPRRMLLRQVLRRQPLHRRDERRGILRQRQREAVGAALVGARHRVRDRHHHERHGAGRQHQAAADPATSATPPKPERPARRRSSRASQVETGENQHRSRRAIPFQMSPWT